MKEILGEHKEQITNDGTFVIVDEREKEIFFGTKQSEEERELVRIPFQELNDDI